MKPDCIFTDMDGTVLGHHDYSYAPVLPVLQTLKAQRVPVVINSSKTFAELTTWMDKLGLEPPFIAENGGVIYLPAGEKRVLGTPYPQIRAILNSLRQAHGWEFLGFGDMSVDKLVEVTGLTHQDAKQAMQREVTEPVLWQDSDENLAIFESNLAIAGLRLVRGGRFYHVMGNHDKAKAMLTLVNSGQLSGHSNMLSDRDKVYIVALGDGKNDQAMLEAANVAVVLPAANFSCLEITPAIKGVSKKRCLEKRYPEKVIYTQTPAPQGWSEAIEGLLSEVPNAGS